MVSIVGLKARASWLPKLISSKREDRKIEAASDAVTVKGGWHSVSQLGICLGSQFGDLPLCLSSREMSSQGRAGWWSRNLHSHLEEAGLPVWMKRD